MVKIKYLVVIIIVFNTVNCLYSFDDYSKRLIYNENKPLELSIFWEQLNSSSLFDMDNELKTFFYESTEEYDPPRTYTFNYSENHLGLALKYDLSKKLMLFSKAPFAMYSLSEKYKWYEADTNNIKYEQNEYKEFSRNILKYLSLGFNYNFFDKKAKGDFLFEARLPVGAQDNPYIRDTTELMLTNVFEIITGLGFKIDFDQSGIESFLKFNYRGGDFSDRILFYSTYNFQTVENTMLGILFEYNHSLGGFRNIPIVNPRYPTLAENSLLLGISFNIFVEDTYLLRLSYKISVLGKNTLNNGVVCIKAAYKI